MIHIGDILGSALKNFRTKSDTDMIQIWDLWEYALEKTIIENAKPGSFKDGTLLVHVSSSVWLHQLSFLKQDMQDKLNHVLGRELVKNIKFKVASLNV